MSDAEPTTAAGRALLDYLVDLRDVGWRDPPGHKDSMHQSHEAITDAIQRVKARLPAIEAEAKAEGMREAVERIRARLRAPGASVTTIFAILDEEAAR